MFTDTHTHMDHPRFDADRDEIMALLKVSGTTVLVNPAVHFESNLTMREKLDGYDWIYYAAGIHPGYVGNDDTLDDVWMEVLENCIATERGRGKTVAVGETGLDFHRLSRNENGNLDKGGIINLERQYKWFRFQIEMSGDYKLPLILHIRNQDERVLKETRGIADDVALEYIDANAEAIRILRGFIDSLPGNKGIVHCFSGKRYEEAMEYISMGFRLGIGGAVTHADKPELREIVRKVPLESIVLETDSPYVMPEGIEGKRNTPLNIPFIAQTVADIKGISLQEVERVTTETAKRIFGIV